MKKKLLIVLLAVAVLFTFMPAAAFAQDKPEYDKSSFAAEDNAFKGHSAGTREIMPVGDTKKSGGWVEDDKGLRYVYDDGTFAKGWFKYGDDPEIAPYYYYLDPSTGYAWTGWHKIGGYWYYFAKEDDPYVYPYGAIYDDGIMAVNGKWYYFGMYNGPAAKWGKMLTGWITEITFDIDPETEVEYEVWKDCLYADPARDGQLTTGWKKIGGYWYYFAKADDPNWDMFYMYCDGAAKINGKWYFFPTWENSTLWGKLQSGWCKKEDIIEYNGGIQYQTRWYYGDPNKDSQLVTGWRKIGGKWYYFEEDWGCEMVGNMTYDSIDGKLWTFNRNGSLHETLGWVDLYEEYEVSGKKMKDSYWVYTDAKGIAKTGWQKIGGYWYYLGVSGYMYANEWASDSKGTCWMDKNGHITKSKWIKSPYDGEWYYLKANGYRAENEWVKDSKGWLHVDANGMIEKSKWGEDEKGTYYLDENGYMVTGEQFIDGYWWDFGDDGRIHPQG